MVTTVLEHSHISPQDMNSELSLPLTFFDIFWSRRRIVRRLFFYQFPCSKSHFADKIIPSIKDSLSQVLKHFPAFAGTFVYPWGPGEKPAIRCKNGDSVPVIFAESEDDLSYFVSNNQARDSDKFYQFLPELKQPVTDEDGSKLISLLAVQVTLFPDRGVCVGLTNDHVVGDASTTTRFIKSWAFICKHGGDAEFLADESLRPNFDRSLINDRYGDLTERVWNRLRNTGNKEETAITNNAANKVRATFVMDQAGIQKLKKICNNQQVLYVSTFSVTCAYAWTCLAKSSAEDEGPQHFICAADLRARMDPPLPSNYSGNAVYPLVMRSEMSRLICEDGFVTAAKVIGDVIHQTLIENRKDLVPSVEDLPSKFKEVNPKRFLGVAGSPLFDVYEADFGWERPSKFELVSIDDDGAVSLCKSRDLENGLEITFSMDKMKMAAFANLFTNGLK